MTPRELRARLDRGEPIVVLDVRNRDEWDLAHIDGATLIPLPELEARLGELDPAACHVVHCRTGVRSARAVTLLRDRGLVEVINLAGGIHRWADEVDSTLPKY